METITQVFSFISQNSEMISWFISTVLGGYIGYDYLKKPKQKTPKESQNQQDQKKEGFDARKAKEVKTLFDEILQDKFNFYFVTEILPIYGAGKTPDKKQLNEIKEKFMIDVTVFINKNFKEELKKYYTSEGIKMYIIEKFFYKLNKFDTQINRPTSQKKDDDKLYNV